MKTLKPAHAVATVLTTMLILTLNAGCKKQPHYEADPNNPYVNSHPTYSGGEARPGIHRFSPASGLPNTVVEISGRNFDAVAANNIVTVGGVPATVNSASPQTISITIPLNAVTGPIAIKTGDTTITSVIDFKVLTSTVSTYLTLTTKIEHISFAENGNLFGENPQGVYQITSGGAITLYNNGQYQFGSLWGSGYHKAEGFGDVYVADRVAGKILRITPSGAVGTLAGGQNGIADGVGNEAKFAVPIGIALDEAGNIYTTDSHRIRKITSSGVVTTLAGGVLIGAKDGVGSDAQFGDLQGLTVDGDGSIYVTDRQFLNIRKITKSGGVTTLAGSGATGLVDGPGAAAQFVDPINVLADQSGNLVVADGNSTTGYAIRLVNKLGAVTTLLNGQILNAPDGMALDPEGNLYVVNTGTNTILKLTFK
ncbi:IPT/TIG domain-containing protein [Mucilaginibacter panaciglaebae]|uniref:IPT/TIG domain-containing protein n=1 Tax=Mucilaginibacter panaciglaebae TaxID=502331 RepID=A0ABP7WV94_9SPHI